MKRSIEFNEETRANRMLLFQEAILARFGFLPCVVQKKQLNKDVSNMRNNNVAYRTS